MTDLPTHILIVEDEADIRRFVRLTLESEGHTVHEAATLQRGLIEAGTRRPDLVVLDLGLPDGDGVDLIRDLRTWSAMPIIVLGPQRRGQQDRSAGRGSRRLPRQALWLGRADGPRARPATPQPAGIRRRGHTRHPVRPHHRGPGPPHGRAPHGEDGSEALHLTPIEYKLLTYLASQPDRVITHQQLLKAVWGPGHAEDTHYVRVHMANLRKKVELNASMPRHLVTEAGIGYRFVP